MRSRLLCTLFVALVICGCSAPPPAKTSSDGGGANSTDTAKAESKKPSVKLVDADGLPVGDPMPPMDEGRIELSRPKDWSVPSRDSKYVVQFAKTKNLFPRVTVTVDEDWAELGDVTPDNVEEFAAALTERLESPEHKVALIEPVLPMVIGERAVARYVRRTKFKTAIKSVSVERQVLVAVIGGRTYTIDLQTPPGTLPENRDAGYAVAASLKAASE